MNFIKPGSQASFKNSSLSVTKNIRHLDKTFSNAFYAKNQLPTVIQGGHCI